MLLHIFMPSVNETRNPRSSSYVKRMYRCFTDSIHEPQQKATWRARCSATMSWESWSPTSWRIQRSGF